MGEYDDIPPERLRSQLVRLAKLILRMDEEGGLLESAAELQRALGDLRQMLFAYEIRSTSELGDGSDEDGGEDGGENGGTDPTVKESLRVVREAIERQEELEEELNPPPSSFDEEREEED